MGIPRQEYWSVLPFRSPGGLPNIGIEPTSPSGQVDSLSLSQHGNPILPFSSIIQLCPTLCNPRTATQQASLSITNSQSLLKLMSIELVMPPNHLILCHTLLLPPSIFPSIRVFSNESFFASGGQSIGVSASASVSPMNIQD